ncbi:unnamed protein product, partial [Polarella glacialis]
PEPAAKPSGGGMFGWLRGNPKTPAAPAAAGTAIAAPAPGAAPAAPGSAPAAGALIGPGAAPAPPAPAPAPGPPLAAAAVPGGFGAPGTLPPGTAPGTAAAPGTLPPGAAAPWQPPLAAGQASLPPWQQPLGSGQPSLPPWQQPLAAGQPSQPPPQTLPPWQQQVPAGATPAPWSTAAAPQGPGAPGGPQQPVLPQPPLLPMPPRRQLAQPKRPAQLRQEDLRAAVESWISLWQDCRSLAPMPPVVAGNGCGEGRLYILRVACVADFEIPVVAAGNLGRAALMQLGRAAESDAPEALAVYIRLSLIYAPAGTRPEIYGHTFLGPRLPVRRAVSRVTTGSSQGVLCVTAAVEPSQTFILRSASASRELQLLAEVVVFEDPPKRPVPGGPPVASRIWRLALPGAGMAKARAAPKPKPKPAPQRSQTGLGLAGPPPAAAPAGTWPPAGGRADMPWPFQSMPAVPPIGLGAVFQGPSGPVVNTGLPAQDEGITLGWSLLRFDLATEGRRLLPQRRLRAGALRQQLVKMPATTLALQGAALGKAPPKKSGLSADIAAEAALEQLLLLSNPDKGALKQVGTLDVDLEALPLPEVARRLLPQDFPAPAEAQRLGGITVTEDPLDGLLLEADISPSPLEPDVSLRGLCITMPDAGWLDGLVQKLPMPANSGVQSGFGWQLEGLHALAGTHNSLRWLDEPLRGLSSAGVAPCPLDDAGHMWRLTLSRQDGGGSQRWFFGGEVPLEFVCNADCAVVVELVATLRAPGTSALPPSEAASASLLGSQGYTPAEVRQSHTLGWLLALPLYHATSEAVLSGAASSAAPGVRPTVAFELQLLQGPGLSLSGQEVWSPSTPAPLTAGRLGPALAASPMKANFELGGARLLQWLRSHVPDPPRAAVAAPPPAASVMYPSYQQSPLPAPVDLQVATASLLGRPPTAQEVQAAQQSAAFPSLCPPGLQPQVVVTQPHAAAPTPVSAAAAPVVERVYLRDQAVQSDPPPIPGIDDNVIAAGVPGSSSHANAGTQSGPLARPLGALDRARLLQELAAPGGSGASAAAAGPSAPVPPDVPQRRPELRWKFEEEDLLQADEVTVELLTHRSFSPNQGERIYFQLRFFLFPPSRTTVAGLAGNPGEACLLRSALTNERLALVYHSDGFATGSAASPASAVHRRLVEHMSARSAEIEMWNADSNMQIGTVSVPLERLARQGQPVAK